MNRGARSTTGALFVYPMTTVRRLDNVTIIDLHTPTAECFVCERTCSLLYGVPRYEDLIVPDDYDGEWGGAAVCARCFYLVRGLQAEFPGATLQLADVRKLNEE